MRGELSKAASDRDGVGKAPAGRAGIAAASSIRKHSRPYSSSTPPSVTVPLGRPPGDDHADHVHLNQRSDLLRR